MTEDNTTNNDDMDSTSSVGDTSLLNNNELDITQAFEVKPDSLDESYWIDNKVDFNKIYRDLVSSKEKKTSTNDKEDDFVKDIKDYNFNFSEEENKKYENNENINKFRELAFKHKINPEVAKDIIKNMDIVAEEVTAPSEQEIDEYIQKQLDSWEGGREKIKVISRFAEDLQNKNIIRNEEEAKQFNSLVNTKENGELLYRIAMMNGGDIIPSSNTEINNKYSQAEIDQQYQKAYPLGGGAVNELELEKYIKMINR